MSTLKERLDQIEQRIAVACECAHRDTKSVTLLPVSKTFDASVIREAVGLGLNRFGENRLQEIAQKAPELSDCDVQWVVIGSVQTNKAKEVAKYATELQSLDRIELALALHKRLLDNGRTLDVLVQVKTSPEESKSGLAPELLDGFLRELAELPTLRVKGLMTMAILSEDTQAVRECFVKLRVLRDQMQALGIEGISLDRLSMGMSGDFEIAIEEGSTEIRVGSALFGSR
ncbi:MAG: YggS family pyridoxal phosphate-dependent enzyme [Burkholderiaceae bacterium]|nr:YggS family pyridoxal phosphate-dependent enzyme [Burkholderiaceae bacterium]